MKSKMLLSSAVAMMAISCASHYTPDQIRIPEPWAMRNQYKGSGTGTTGHNVARSRAKAKAARKARRVHRKRWLK